MHPAIEKYGSGNVAVLLVYFCKFQHELAILSQKQHLMIRLDGLTAFLLPPEVPSEGQLVAEGLVDDLVLGSLLHFIKSTKQTA
jgi:hypothetical protein